MQNYDDNDPGDETPDEYDMPEWDALREAILDYFNSEMDEALLDRLSEVEGAVRYVTVIHEDGAVTEFDIGPDIDWDDAVDMASEVMYTVDNINHPARSALA